MLTPKPEPVLNNPEKGLVVEIVKEDYGHDHDFPKKSTPGSAGYDLFANEGREFGSEILPGQTALVMTSFRWKIPEGHVGLVCSRSGLALNHGVFVLNAPGIIDSDYRGPLGVILHNVGKQIYRIKDGDKIAQLVIVPLTQIAKINQIESFDNDKTERGEGGFGSTGK